jgi:hypothetical protein
VRRRRSRPLGTTCSSQPIALPHCCSVISAITSRRVISRPLLVQGSSPADGRSHELRTSPALLLLSGRRSLSSLADSRASESPPTAGACTDPANGRPFERSKQQSRRRKRSVPPLRNLSTLTRRTQTSAFTKTRAPRQPDRPDGGLPLRAGGRVKRQRRSRGRVGDSGSVRRRPGSAEFVLKGGPEAAQFDYAIVSLVAGGAERGGVRHEALRLVRLPRCRDRGPRCPACPGAASSTASDVFDDHPPPQCMPVRAGVAGAGAVWMAMPMTDRSLVFW